MITYLIPPNFKNTYCETKLVRKKQTDSYKILGETISNCLFFSRNIGNLFKDLKMSIRKHYFPLDIFLTLFVSSLLVL